LIEVFLNTETKLK